MKQPNGEVDLRTLLTQHTHHSWRRVYEYIQCHPHEVRQRYYCNESPLQLLLRLRGHDHGLDIDNDEESGAQDMVELLDLLQALVDADPESIYSREWGGDVFQRMAGVNPGPDHDRDEGGRTCLHTACAEGHSAVTLRWLLNVEDRLSLGNHHDLRFCTNPQQRMNNDGCAVVGGRMEQNATLRTDYPEGELPLHLIAARSSFACGTYLADQTMPQHPHHPIDKYLIPSCNINPNILRAYASTTAIRQAHPRAVWIINCKGEIPLHAAASWGNVGSVLSLLIGAAVESGVNSGPQVIVAKAALVKDDKGKTPLDRACERVCDLCMHGKGPSVKRDGSRGFHDPFPLSIRSNACSTSDDHHANVTGEDIFQTSVVGGVGTRSNIGWRRYRQEDSDDHGQRITGWGIVGRNDESFSSCSSVNGGPIDPIRGLQKLHDEGGEELAKVELLARAAYGFFDVGNIDGDGDYEDFSSDEAKPGASPLAPPPETAMDSVADGFQLLHAVIALGCQPEIIWHVAAKYPHQVAEMDGFGRVPLFLACERLAELYQQGTNNLKATDESISDRTLSYHGIEEVDDDDESESDAGRRFVCSILLGDDHALFLFDDHRSTIQSMMQPQQRPTRLFRTRESSLMMDAMIDCRLGEEDPPSSELEEMPSFDNASMYDDGLMENLLRAREVIYILLYSPLFSQVENKTAEQGSGQLALHVVLEAGLQWNDRGVVCSGCSSEEEASEWIDRDVVSGWRRRSREERVNGQLHFGDRIVANNCNNSVVQMLVNACPGILEVRDGKTGLFPFMIAATPKKVLNMYHESENDECCCTNQLETVYRLLLKAPTLVSHPM